MNNYLPLDIALVIIQLSVWTPIACERTGQIELAKHIFHKGISEACKAYRELYMSEWSRHMTLHNAMDWDTALQYGFADNVRTLVLKESALISHKLVKDHLNLAKFGLIHTLILDCHNDVGCSKSSGTQGQWSYKRILPILPRGLTSLVILNAHGPDLQVIQRATEQCSSLEHLSLGRCTKFNHPDNCDFWKQFPEDHDSYFSIKGTEGYADALGKELRALTKLKSVYVNVYLTDTKYLGHPPSSAPIDSVTLPPQEDPVPTNPTTPVSPPPVTTPASLEINNDETGERLNVSSIPVNGQSQPASAESQDQQETKEAEKAAAEILFGCHPSLKTTGFISFWSEDHLAWSLHEREARDYAYTSPDKAPDPGEESPRHKDPEVNKRA